MKQLGYNKPVCSFGLGIDTEQEDLQPRVSDTQGELFITQPVCMFAGCT